MRYLVAMGDLAEFSLPVRLFLKSYRWRVIDPLPWTTPRLPVERSRVALVSSGGFTAPGQPPFDPSVKGGDWSFRLIDSVTETGALLTSHRSESFDRSGIEADPNLAIPLDRLREMERGGEIGSLAPRAVSFMGSITAPKRLMLESAPAIAEALLHDGVDLALLVPV